MCFRKSFSNTHMRAPAWLEIMKQNSYSHKHIFFLISFAMYQTHDWYPCIFFNPLMILVLSEPRALKCKCHMFIYIYIREIYVQIYYGNSKSDKCIVIHAKCTIRKISKTWIYSTYQFKGYGITEHDTKCGVSFVSAKTHCSHHCNCYAVPSIVL